MIDLFNDDKHIAVAQSRSISIWNLDTQSLRVTIDWLEKPPISDLVTFPLKNQLIAGGEHVAVIFDWDGNEIVRFHHIPRIDVPPSYLGETISICISSDESLVATGYSGELHIWDANTGNLVNRLSHRYGENEGILYEWHSPERIAFVNGNRYMLSSGIFGDALLWDLHTGEVVCDLSHLKDKRYIPEYGDGGICDISISSMSNDRLALLCIDYPYIIHAMSGEVVGAIDFPAIEDWRTFSAKLSTENRILILYGEYNNTPHHTYYLIIDLGTLSIQHQIEGASSDYVLSRNGEKLIINDEDNLYIYDTNESTEPQILKISTS